MPSAVPSEEVNSGTLVLVWGFQFLCIALLEMESMNTSLVKTHWHHSGGLVKEREREVEGSWYLFHSLE